MPKGLMGLISTSAISLLLIISALVFSSHPGQAAPSPTIPQVRGACYFSGDKGCKPDLTEKECHSPLNNYNYWDAGKKCVDETHVLVEDYWIERCTDARRLPEAEKKCREKLEAEVKAQESATTPDRICPDKFLPLTKVAISASYVDRAQRLCIANCSMVYQCVEKVETPPPAPGTSSTPAPTYVPTPTQTPDMPMAPTPPPPTDSPKPSETPPPPPPGY